MSKKLQNAIPKYIIQRQKITTNGQPGQRITGNRKETRSNKSRRFFRVHLTFHIFVQQKEIQKSTGTVRMGSQDKSNRGCTKCQSLCDDNKGE